MLYGRCVTDAGVVLLKGMSVKVALRDAQEAQIEPSEHEQCWRMGASPELRVIKNLK